GPPLRRRPRLLRRRHRATHRPPGADVLDLHDLEGPAPTSRHCASGPATGWGVGPAPVVVPLPSWPEPLPPQQYATPPGVRPQSCRYPAVTAVKCKLSLTRAGLLGSPPT